LGIAIRHWGGGRDAGGDAASLEQDLVFAGLIGMIDPPRDEAAPAVARAKSAGVRPVMITGDHPRTAVVIARELGITDDDRVVSGADLTRMSDEALDAIVATTSVYARVSPGDKLRIVQSLQRCGFVVGMTGDGVNDSPALKTADIGIAMGVTGTDVSKRAADVVLADDNFATIVAAIEEGRAIFANIRKFLRYLLSSNIGEVLTMFFGVLFAGPLGLPAEHGAIVLPLVATQILWINLVTDGAPALALGLDPADADLMRQAPRGRPPRRCSFSTSACPADSSEAATTSASGRRWRLRRSSSRSFSTCSTRAPTGGARSCGPFPTHCSGARFCSRPRCTSSCSTYR
jgi:Ca2+-transporting ATPase